MSESSPFLPAEVDLSLGGNSYRLGHIDARTQLHIMRRLGPLASVTLGTAGAPIHMTRMLAEMTNEDLDYIINATLSTVKRRTGESWMPVYNAGARRMQFDDLHGAELLQLVQASVKTFQDPFVRLLADVMGFRLNSASTTESQTST